MRIHKQTIENWLDNVASSEPTPGGGAVAALTGAIAAALCEMVVGLTKENKDIGILGYKAKKYRDELLKLADEDCKAFDEVMTAYKSKDKDKIKKSLQRAIDIPEKTALLSNEVLKLARIVLKKGNKNARSDTLTAIYLSRASIKSAGENIEINKKALARLG